MAEHGGSMKPSDVFVGVVEFFSVLLPGAIASYLGMAALDHFHHLKNPHLHLDFDPKDLPLLHEHEVAAWAAFLICSYILGHVLFAVASLLDEVELLYRWPLKIIRGVL